MQRVLCWLGFHRGRALLGFVDGDKPIMCGPCEQVMAEEREPVR